MFSKNKLNVFDYAFTNLDLDILEDYINTPNVFNPFEDKIEIELENRGLRELLLMINPDYIYFAAKLLLNIELHPLQCVILKQIWNHPFPMLIMSRGGGKTFMMAVYLLLRCALYQGTKAIIAGAAFRQAKFVYEYMEQIFDNAPVLQSIFKGNSGSRRQVDMWEFSIGLSKIISIPLGTGDRIRGYRCNIILCEEFNSIPLEIYEIVLSQFAAVSQDPMEKVKHLAKQKALTKRGLTLEASKSNILTLTRNQSIISGTVRYQFEPLAMYWKKYKELIESKGERIKELFGDDIGDALEWKDFCIIRIPYSCIPEGYMSKEVVARAKATMHLDFYLAEYNCIPISDSAGFFKRSLIENCTAKDSNIYESFWPSWCSSPFDARTLGNKDLMYVMGIDPASEADNFSITILELHSEHVRVVYTWTTRKDKFNQQKDVVNEKNFFAFCSRKVRDLMKVFNIVAIGIDSQGGGKTVEETLHDNDKMEAGEIPLWAVIDPEKEKETDDRAGSHILHMINFVDAKWTSEANHGMKKDMESKFLLFPRFNAILLGLASEKEKLELDYNDVSYDSLENCMLEIEELKNELSIIMHTSTPSGREHWDTPEIKLGVNRKERMRKDRYTALLIANSVARNMHRTAPPPKYHIIGGVAGYMSKPKSGKMYEGPEWFQPSSKIFRGITR